MDASQESINQAEAEPTERLATELQTMCSQFRSAEGLSPVDIVAALKKVSDVFQEAADIEATETWHGIPPSAPVGSATDPDTGAEFDIYSVSSGFVKVPREESK